MSKNDDGIELNVYKSSGSGYERVAIDEDNIDDELLNASNQPILNDEEVEHRAADLTSDLDRGGDEESETELSPEEAERRLFLTRTEDETRGGGRNDDIELRHRGTAPKHVHYRDIDSRPGEEENLLANRTTVEEETNFGGLPVDNRGEAGSSWLDDINVIRDNSVLSKMGQLFLLTTFILAVFLVILVALPNCIFRLEYNELALTRSVWTGRVRYDKVYEPGFNFILPWYEGIIFDKAAHSYHLKELNIFTTDKLSVKTQFIIYYFLDKRNLGELYRKFGLDYKPIIESVAKTVLLNHGLEFSIDDYRTKRSEIRRVLRDKLKAKLERDYSIRILDIYLGRITFTKEINQLNLLRMLNGIFNEKAAHDKQTNVTRAETAYKISLLRNEARLLIDSAQAKADNEVRRIEEVNLNARLEYAHSNGLNNSYSQLNFFDGRPKASQRAISFCYLSALINNENVRFIQKVENTGRYVFSELDDSISPPIEIISS